MKKAMIAVLVSMFGVAYAADFSALSISVPDLQEAAKSMPFSSAPAEYRPAGYHDGHHPWHNTQEAREIRRAFREITDNTYPLLASGTSMWQREHSRKEVLRALIWLNSRDMRSLDRVVDRMDWDGSLRDLRMNLRRLANDPHIYFNIRNEAKELKRKVRKLANDWH